MDMIKVQDLLGGRSQAFQAKGSYTFEDLKTHGEAGCDWDIRVEMPGLTVRGELSTRVVLECGRCLQPYEVPVTLSIHERYVFSRYVEATEREKELQAEDFFEVIDEEGELDLKDLVHQILILETSDETLCGQADCQMVTGAH